MRDKSITRKISQGMYILTTVGGGCCVDAVSQISGGDNPLIGVAVMKKNYTNKLMKDNNIFALSVLGEGIDPKIIINFGMKSMRDYNKFESVDVEEVEGVNVIKGSLGYMVCEKVDMIENDTHTLFIGKLIEADKFSDGKEMTYGYYQEHKDELVKVVTTSGKTAWVCTVCGYVYYGDSLPDDYKCPICGVGREMFKLKEE